VVAERALEGSAGARDCITAEPLARHGLSRLALTLTSSPAHISRSVASRPHKPQLQPQFRRHDIPFLYFPRSFRVGLISPVSSWYVAPPIAHTSNSDCTGHIARCIIHRGRHSRTNAPLYGCDCGVSSLRFIDLCVRYLACCCFQSLLFPLQHSELNSLP
jgi:hypothetical protein